MAVVAGCFHSLSQASIVVISGCWAASIWAARRSTSAFSVLVGACDAVSIACWWWAIISWAKVTSWLLKALLSLPQAARSARAVRLTSSRRIGIDVLLGTGRT